MNLSKRSKLLIGLFFSACIVLLFGYSIIYKPHQSIQNQSVSFQGTGVDFKTEVMADETKWNNAIVQIKGTITDKDEMGYMLDESIYCQFEQQKQPNLSIGTTIHLKGRFIGYDDLLEEIKLDNCFLIEE
jgi:hypothetical protein